MKRKNGSILALLLLVILIISACNVKEEEKPVTKEEEPVVESNKEIATDGEEQELIKDEQESAQNSAQESVQKTAQKSEQESVQLAEEIETTEDMVASGNLIIRYYYVHGALEAQVIPEQKGVRIFSEIPKDELVPVSVKIKQKIEIHSSEELIGKYDLTFESYDATPVNGLINSNQEVVGKGKFYAVLTPNWNENVDTLYILFESK